jgi:hypothetical protein
MRAIDALLVHYSTDYVFDGSASRPYREDDATAPLGVYGAASSPASMRSDSSGARHAILRTAWVYASHGRNFLLTMLRLARERDELRVVADQVGAPTPAAWIADATADLIRHGVADAGTWHLVTSGQVSWHGFASAIMEDAHALGLLARMPTVVPITTAEFPTPAKRPAYSVLDTTRLRMTTSASSPRTGAMRVARDLAGDRCALNRRGNGVRENLASMQSASSARKSGQRRVLSARCRRFKTRATSTLTPFFPLRHETLLQSKRRPFDREPRRRRQRAGQHRRPQHVVHGPPGENCCTSCAAGQP